MAHLLRHLTRFNETSCYDEDSEIRTFNPQDDALIGPSVVTRIARIG